MELTSSWISFYECKMQGKMIEIQMEYAEYSSAKHSCAAYDGRKIETKTYFPPYKGITLEESRKVSKAIPLVLEYKMSLGIDGRIHRVSEQINWTNTALKGHEMNVAIVSGQQEQFDSLQVYVNHVNKELNDFHFSVSNFENLSENPKKLQKTLSKELIWVSKPLKI